MALPHLCGKNHNVSAANLALLLLLLMAVPSTGQVRGTTISGSIGSPSGSPIASAAITLKNLATNEARSFTANADGEMVPHIAVEDVLQELAGGTEQIFVVTAVPDEKKNERLVVLHTLAEPQLEECLKKLGKSDLPALWRPRADNFLRIEKLPYLGTGKLDLRKARELALEMMKRTCRE